MSNKPKSKDKMDEASGSLTFKNPVTFRECFSVFSKFGDTKSDGTLISLSQSDKWMRQSKVIDGKKVTTTDTAIFFKRYKSPKLNFHDYEKFVEELVKSKEMSLEEVKRQMGAAGAPGISTSAANNKVSNTVERLTDPSRYTGSHKQRFDESGKGRGLDGRRDNPDQSGYVHGYQNKNTYDKTH